MEAVHSKNGTTIAFDCTGNGPVLIMIGGATATRTAAGEEAVQLAKHFTVINHDRRGRGDSGDGAPMLMARRC